MATITTLNDGITGASFRGQINTNFSNLNTDKAELSGGTFTGDISVPDEAYGAGWNGSLEVPTKNAVYDEIETKQDTLVSGTNVKTVNGNSIVGSGDIVIASGGDVVGPASSTDNAIARFDSTTGKLLQNSGVTIGDTNIISGVDTLNTVALNATGQVSFTNTSSAALIIDGGITFEGATNRRIDDGASNELIKFPTTSVASAVNEFTISNAATGNGPTISATGGDTNIDFNIVTKGSGILKVNGSALGSGNVVGPASATDNAVARFDSTTGKLIQNSAVTIADTTGDITAGKYNTVAISGTSTPTIAITGTVTISGTHSGTSSGTNSGDQTSIVGITGTMAQFDTAVSDGNLVYQSQALGTPASGSLTNCTSLPVAGIAASTSTALGVGSIELGHATDTTISRSSAGVIAVEGVVVPTISSASTLTNKTLTTPTISKPVMSATDPTAQTYTPAAAGTATLDLSLSNQHDITMPAGNITIALSNVTNNQLFVVTTTQDATGSRTVTWFTTIRWAGGVAPTLTTTASKRDMFGFKRTGASTYDGFIIAQNI